MHKHYRPGVSQDSAINDESVKTSEENEQKMNKNKKIIKKLKEDDSMLCTGQTGILHPWKIVKHENSNCGLSSKEVLRSY